MPFALRRHVGLSVGIANPVSGANIYWAKQAREDKLYHEKPI